MSKYKEPGRKIRLFKIGLLALEQDGWRVERIRGVRQSSVRRITKNKESHVVSIRTTQDTWIAFPRKSDDSGWATLDDVDYVVVVTVNDKDMPRDALVFMIHGNEMRKHFDRAYQSRLEAGYTIPLERGVWVSMLTPEDPKITTTIGGGIALNRMPLFQTALDLTNEESVIQRPETQEMHYMDESLTISEAKRRLAESLGVTPEQVKIVIEA